MWPLFIIVAIVGLFIFYENEKTKTKHIEKIKEMASINNDNNPEKLTELGLHYFHLKEYDAAFSKYKAAFDLGSPTGAALLGSMYLNGLSVKKDIHQAELLFKNSAENGSPLGQRLLGAMYMNGYGKSRDSIYWLMISSKNQDPFAPFILGNIYEKGEILKKDLAKAAAWYEFSTKYNQNYSEIESSAKMIEKLNPSETQVFEKTKQFIKQLEVASTKTNILEIINSEIDSHS